MSNFKACGAFLTGAYHRAEFCPARTSQEPTTAPAWDLYTPHEPHRCGFMPRASQIRPDLAVLVQTRYQENPDVCMSSVKARSSRLLPAERPCLSRAELPVPCPRPPYQYLK